MSTSDISCDGESRCCVGLILPHSGADCLGIMEAATSRHAMRYFGLSALCAVLATAAAAAPTATATTTTTTEQEEQISLHLNLQTAFVHAAADPQLILTIQHVLLPYTFNQG